MTSKIMKLGLDLIETECKELKKSVNEIYKLPDTKTVIDMCQDGIVIDIEKHLEIIVMWVDAIQEAEK